MSYNGWEYNDWSCNDQSYNDYPHNECSYGSYIDPYMSEEYFQSETCEEESFDQNEFKAMMQQLLQNQQQIDQDQQELNAKLDRVYNNINNKHEVLCTNVKKLETQIAKLVSSDESEYENWFAGALTSEQTQSQLDGTCNSTLEIDDFEEISLPCIEKVVSSNLLLIDECLDIPCDSLDKVDYSLVNSTNLEIDFIFPPNAFIPQGYSNIKDHFRKYFSFVKTCFNKFVNTNFNNHLVLLVWTIVFLLAQMVYCENRRRTKGPLAQPFDSCD